MRVGECACVRVRVCVRDILKCVMAGDSDFWKAVLKGNLAAAPPLAVWVYYSCDPWMLASFAAKVLMLYVTVCCFSAGISLLLSLGTIGLLPGQPNFKYLLPREQR